MHWEQAEQWADTMHIAQAQQLLEMQAQGTWREYTYHETHPDAKRRGTHPGSFRAFLDGFALEQQALGRKVHSAELATRLQVVAWGLKLGLTPEIMAFLGLGLLAAMHRVYRSKPDGDAARVLAEAVLTKQTQGTVYLPSLIDNPDVTAPKRPSFSFETIDNPEAGTYAIKAFVVRRNGDTYRNILPYETMQYVCRILRASNVVVEATQA